MTPRDKVALGLATAKAISPMLAGLPPEVHGSVLAHLTAIWLAGFQPAEVRGEILASHEAAIWKLVHVFDEAPRPPS